MTKIRPFLKWAGSKYNCLNEIISSLPPGRRLIEPFAGSGVVFMNTNYSSYILAESNPDLVQIFTILQEQGEDFVDYCQQYFQPGHGRLAPFAARDVSAGRTFLRCLQFAGLPDYRRGARTE